jgi:Leucine-rich repeat (LRR) protein
MLRVNGLCLIYGHSIPPRMREDTQHIIQERIAEAKRNGGHLYLAGLGLQALPDEVGALQRLRVVDLRDNALTDLPPEGWGLAQVEELDLSGNAFETVPKALRRCQALRVLRLSDNRLTSLSLDLELPSELTTLKVDRNHIRVISGLGRPHKLQWLSANQNEVELITLSDKAARSLLASISLEDNRLSKLPAGMQALSRLHALNMRRNLLVEMPACIAEMQALEFLRADGNQLEQLGWTDSSLPTHLRQLQLADNRLASLPDCVAQLPQLTDLQLDGNPLTGLPALPVSLQNLSARACSLESLPPLRPCSHIERVDVSANGIAGTLSLELPARLKTIDLHDNLLTDLHLVVPEGALLEEFTAFDNQIEQLSVKGMPAHLQVLDFSQNRLRTFPDFFSQSRSLTRVYLGGNLLEAIPSGLRGLPHLHTLVLSQNQIRMVPDWMAQMPWPNCLWLHDNPLEVVSPDVLQGRWVALMLHGTQFAASTQPAQIRSWLTQEVRLREALTGSLPTLNWNNRLWVETKACHDSPYEWGLKLRSEAACIAINVGYLSDIKIGQTGLFVERYLGVKVEFIPLGPLSEEERKEVRALLCPYYQASYLSQLMDLQDTDEGPDGLGYLDYIDVLDSEEYKNADSVARYLEGRG